MNIKDISQYARVKIKLADGGFLEGTVLDVNDKKPGDVDITILWDKPLHGLMISETHPQELVVLGPISKEQKARAEKGFKILKEYQGQYEAAFAEKNKHDIQKDVSIHFEKDLLETLAKSAATYDTKEQEDLDLERELSREDVGVEVYPHHDYVEDTLDFPKNPNTDKNQPEHWWGRTKEESEEDQKGGEKQLPGAVPGFWNQSPGMFNAMPMQSSSNNFSVTVEFKEDGMRILGTWDKNDLPDGLSEEQTLSHIMSFLENNIPNATATLKNVTAESIDLTNRTISLRVGGV